MDSPDMQNRIPGTKSSVSEGVRQVRRPKEPKGCWLLCLEFDKGFATGLNMKVSEI